jgi:Gpi18-like mannosyltransferase
MIFYCTALFAIGALGFFLLCREDVLRNKAELIVAAVLLLIAMAIRAAFGNYETLDYQNFLSVWVDYFRQNGGVLALKESIGNYNVPYLYFLAIFSYIPVSDLYLIKLLSIVFEMLMAWYVMRLVGLFTDSTPKKFAGFFITLFLPTVILNGACWGQCDAVYTALAVMSIYYALADRPWASMICIAASFAFKLQAVFIMPVFLIFMFAGKIKLRHLPVFPLTYVVIVLPAVCLGRPFLDTLTLYIDQAGTVGSGLNYNSPSIYSFMTWFDNINISAGAGIIAAFALVIVMFVAAFIFRKRLSNLSLLIFAVIFVIGIPLLLPHMHDRYFFMADVLTLCLAVIYPRRSYIPVLASFASLLGYHAYLKLRYLMPMYYGTIALAAALIVLFFDLGQSLYRKNLKNI